MTPSGSAPNAASPRPLGRSTNSAPGATVVDVVVDDVDVVVDVEVVVDAAVVTGVVVLVTTGSDVELVLAAEDDPQAAALEFCRARKTALEEMK